MSECHYEFADIADNPFFNHSFVHTFIVLINVLCVDIVQYILILEHSNCLYCQPGVRYGFNEVVRYGIVPVLEYVLFQCITKFIFVPLVYYRLT